MIIVQSVLVEMPELQEQNRVHHLQMQSKLLVGNIVLTLTENRKQQIGLAVLLLTNDNAFQETMSSSKLIITDQETTPVHVRNRLETPRPDLATIHEEANILCNHS